MTKPHHQLANKHPFNDSLIQYGDGVFETMLAVGNTIHHWDYHWQRLENNCRRLQLSPVRNLRRYTSYGDNNDL